MIYFSAEFGDIIFNIQSRLLLSTDTSDNGESDNHHTEDHNIEEAFQHIYFVMLFMACLWFIGKVFARCGLPSLVGEIVCGIILGPNLLNLVPYSDALVVVGEIGLVLLVLEAGIDVSIGHLKVVGYRGLSVAVFGSMIPLGIGTGLAISYGQSLQSAIAIGACLAPTSMGIALNVLRNAKVLNTPTGQLIIAAAVLDDVIALMLLSELEAMSDPSNILAIILPLIISPAFILFFGFLAIRVTPWIIQKIMMATSKHQHENVILLLLFVATFIMIPVCFYAGSSHLLGAFLAGLMFCTDHTIHEAWSNQIKRIMQWMLRIFFACTIGFAVPIQDFWSKPVIIGGLLYFVAIIGKILTGIFAKPLTISEFFTIAFSMSAWGEFAFILATASFSTGTIDKDSYSSVLMAVLLSVVLSPLLLRITLSISRKQKQKMLTGARDAHHDFDILDIDGDINNHPVYFCVHTKGRGKWGHQDKLLHCIFALNLEIIDFRAFNEAEYNHSHHLPIVQDVFYVQDKILLLPPTKRLGKLDEKKLQQRYKEIKLALKKTMGDPHALIDVMRWLPGVRRTDDIQSPVKGAMIAGGGDTAIHGHGHGHGIDEEGINNNNNNKNNNNNNNKETTKKKKRKTASYCRKEAYKQARLALDHVDAQRSSSYLVSGISRIRPTHDALHRDKFTYHGGIHTEDDDLIAMAFIDTLTSLHESLSPPNRASPTGSHDKEPLNTDELFAKINTLRDCVERLQVFQPALSDDDRRDGTNISNPPSIHSMDNNNHNNIINIPRSFDAHYARTFTPLQHPNISGGNDGDKERIPRARTEHGSINKIMHTHTFIKDDDDNKVSFTTLNDTMNKPKPLGPPQPGMFVSHSHGLLPSVANSHSHSHSHHHHFNHLPRDVFPRDNYIGSGFGHYHNPTIPSQSHGSHSNDQHHPLHVSSTEDSHSTNSDDVHVDTMYGDEDEHHRPLGLYTNLDDLDEEPLDEDDEDEDDERSQGSQQENNNNKDIKLTFTKSLTEKTEKTEKKEKRKEKGSIKRSTTWSKINIFKHKKLSDDDSDNSNRRQKKRKKKKYSKNKNEKNNKTEMHELSQSSTATTLRNISFDEEDDTIPVNPKMLEIPQSSITLKKENKKQQQQQQQEEEENDNNDNNETQPLKSNNND